MLRVGTQLQRAAACGAFVLAASCGGTGDDAPRYERPVPADAFRPSVGQVLHEEGFADETGTERYLLVRVPPKTGATSLHTLAAATAEPGVWRAVACVSAHEICFQRGSWFVSMISRADIRRNLPGVPLYPDPASGVPRPDEVVVMVQASPYQERACSGALTCAASPTG